MILALLLLTATASAQRAPFSPAACNEEKTQIRTYAAGLKSDCTSDSECATHFLDVDSCAPASVFRKDVNLEKDPFLHELQAKERKACAPIFANRGPCAPPAVVPGCRHSHCIDISLQKHRE
ncbi:MAG: hypothetical protein ACXWR1_17555 [Bdellovibrionota bacterium]